MCSYTEIERVIHKARKPHCCIWCGQMIVVGERYEYERCIFEGDPQSNHWHLECAEDLKIAMSYEPGCFEFTPWEAERPPKRLGFTLTQPDSGGT